MTDNEIIKGAEHCLNDNCDCCDCLYTDKGEYAVQCMAVLIKDQLSLINRQKAEIERLEKECKTTRAYIHDNGLEWDLLSKNKKGKSKCDCYHEKTNRRYTYNPITGQPIGHDIVVGVCWGTKECDECSCGGDEAKCDFYPPKKEMVGDDK